MSEVEIEAVTEEDLALIRQKIIHILTIYPVVSHTMLQGTLGPQLRSAIWRPVLDDLIEEGVVVEDQHSCSTPVGRYNTYKRLRLRGTEVQVDEHFTNE